jgi:hypothetical protein
VAQVRTPLHALADESDPLGMANRALVEAVTGELEPVVAELQEQMPLQEARSVVRRMPAAEVGMDREAAARSGASRFAPRTP